MQYTLTLLYIFYVFSPPPVKPEGTIGLHSVRQSVCPSVCLSIRHTRFPDFSSLCFDTSGWKLVASFYMKSYRSSSTFITIDKFFHELLPFVQIRFPDFSRLCFHISKWKLVASFHMKSYRSSSTFIAVDLLFHELLPFDHNSFSGLFLAVLSHISMTLDRKLPYEELQIKFDFRHGWPTFSWVIALCSKFVFRTFLADTKVHQNNGCRFEFVGVGGGPVLL